MPERRLPYVIFRVNAVPIANRHRGRIRRAVYATSAPETRSRYLHALLSRRDRLVPDAKANAADGLGGNTIVAKRLLFEQQWRKTRVGSGQYKLLYVFFFFHTPDSEFTFRAAGFDGGR